MAPSNDPVPSAASQAVGPTVSFILLRAPSEKVPALQQFYGCLGASFVEEKHGDGPTHFAAMLGGIALEIYETKQQVQSGHDAPLRIGFKVADFELVSKKLEEQGMQRIRVTATGMGRLVDPLGNQVLLESASPVQLAAPHISNRDRPSECFALVAGAGPTGLAATLNLARENLSVRCIDPAPGRSLEWRATGIQPRVLGFLDQVGIGNPVRREAIELLGSTIYLSGTEFVQVAFVDPVTTQHPRSICQGALERFFEHALPDEQSVERRKRVIGFERQGKQYQVKVEDLSSGSSEIITCKILLGCDGARSTVRELCEIGFDNHIFPGRSFMCEAKLIADLDRSRAHFFIMPTSRLIIVPVPGDNTFKISGSLPKHLWPVSSPVTKDDIIAILAEHQVGAFEIQSVHSLSKYTTHRGLANQFRIDAALLCGDAAHLFPPRGGQGMNTGLEDAFAATAAVLRFAQTQDATALTAYDSRRAAVQQRLEAVDRSGRVYTYSNLTSGSFDARKERERVVRDEL